ncbi:FAD-binding oxidoreductase [Henriciella litoralis]|uniref:FAD-binding oxidoreductase n=1 Tax=Henriciella litoralis TaxID=568102 RepID=UPI000A01F508|nr:FAD-linked oxidase C-terminal domain-containing protein [Henriciella litoralis]
MTVNLARLYDVDAVVAELAQLFGDKLDSSSSTLEAHGKDESWHACVPPDAVLFAESTEDVSEAVKICARHNCPIIPFGAGTSLEGHVSAVHGGLSIDTSRMCTIREVLSEDLCVRVDAGVTREQLNVFLRDQGLFFPIDPGANATLGGMAATRASGTNAVRYGTMADNVLELTVVLADGSVIRTGHRARKSAAGYDLTRMFVGSEGTLGIITELTLRLYGIPEQIALGVMPFNSIADATNTVIMAIQMGIAVARIELLDEVQVAASNSYSNLSLPETPMLFVEFHGSEAVVNDQISTFKELAGDFGAGQFEWALQAEERRKLETARHYALYAARALSPGKQVLVTDVCVPISRLADAVVETKADLETSGLVAPLVGHVGDGNFHLFLLVDPDDSKELERAHALHDRLVERAISMGGTCTGEHGIGTGKQKFLELEHASGLPAMRAIKQALDPANIFNPGKIFSI